MRSERTIERAAAKHAPDGGVAGALRPSRSPELQDPLNRVLYHPLAARLARWLLPTAISPNAVSIAGMVIVWGAAFAYAGLDWPAGAVLGFVLHMAWHVVDGADGDLARLRGGSSPRGELIDGLCDYGGHAVLYIALAALLDDRIGGMAWALAALAGGSHMVQTNHAESQRRAYLWWSHGVPWIKHAGDAGDAIFAGRGWFSRTFGPLTRTYLGAASAMTPHIGRIDAAIGHGGAGARRRLIRRATRRSLALQKWLGPNPRTVLLGLSMVATASPLWFFIAELIPLNLLLLYSVVHHRRMGARLLRALG